MPLYVYEVLNKDGTINRIEELFHSYKEVITVHPETGESIRKVITAPFVGSQNSERSLKKKLSNENLTKKNFTKYVRDGDTYHKVAGKEGPSSFKKPSNE